MGTRGATVRYALAAAVVAALAAGAACFSERQEATSPVTTGDCGLPLDSAVVGRTQVVVAIRDFAFVPAEVHVAPGTTVVWVNCEGADIDPHTSTADGGAWDSGFLRPGVGMVVKSAGDNGFRRRLVGRLGLARHQGHDGRQSAQGSQGGTGTLKDGPARLEYHECSRRPDLKRPCNG